MPRMPPRYLTMEGDPPTEIDCAARRKQRARPLRIASKPSHPPPIRAANPARANRRHPQAAPKPTPTTLAHATSISLASSPKPQLQTSKQSRACVHNIAWSSNHLPRHRNTPNSSTTCGFSFILQSLKCRYACRIVPVPITEKGPSCVSLPPASFPSRSRS